MQERFYNRCQGKRGNNKNEKSQKRRWECIKHLVIERKKSGIISVNPNVPALKYGRDMEIETVSKFAEYIKNYHQDCIISECGLVLDETMPYIGASPDRLMSSLYSGKAYIEIRSPYSINHTELNEQNLEYLYKDGDTVKLKQNHKYFTQCFMQMRLQKPKMLTLWFGLRMEW